MCGCVAARTVVLSCSDETGKQVENQKKGYRPNTWPRSMIAAHWLPTDEDGQALHRPSRLAWNRAWLLSLPSGTAAGVLTVCMSIEVCDSAGGRNSPGHSHIAALTVTRRRQAETGGTRHYSCHQR